MGARIVYDGEFQHHGIKGQKWGIITKNVGVNYIPIGRGNSTRGEKVKSVAKGVGSGIATGAKGTAKVIAKGAKKLKAAYDEKKTEEEYRKAHNSGAGKTLSKKEISRMTDQEIVNAINRKRNEQQLYEMMHPQAAAGKQFFDNYVAKTVMELGGQYAKKFLGMKVDTYLRDYIDKNPNYSEETKRDLKYRLNAENLTDRLKREAYEDSIKTEHTRETRLQNLREDLEYEKVLAQETAKYINKLYDDEDARSEARIRNNVATADDRIKAQERQYNAQTSAKVNVIRNALPEDIYPTDDIVAKVHGIKKPSEDNGSGGNKKNNQ